MQQREKNKEKTPAGNANECKRGIRKTSHMTGIRTKAYKMTTG